jgi:hypothetical protein
MVMKILESIGANAILLLSYSALTVAADVNADRSISSQSSVSFSQSNSSSSQSSTSVTTESNGAQTQSSTVSLDRADLRQPHILRVQGEMNNAPIKMKRVDVKINGKLVRTISNSSLELDLAPIVTRSGRYEIDVLAIPSRSDSTISLNFIGTHAQIKQQSSGSGKIDRKLIINVR